MSECVCLCAGWEGEEVRGKEEDWCECVCLCAGGRGGEGEEVRGKEED